MKIINRFNYKKREHDSDIKFVDEVQAFLLAFETFCQEYVGVESKDMIQAWYGFR